MSDNPPLLPWPEANDRYLMAEVDVVRAALENHAARLVDEDLPDRSAAAAAALEAAAAALPAPAALDQLVSLFGLSPFERAVLLMGVGMESAAGFDALCAAAHGNAQRDFPTFRLALDALPGGHWSALSPEGNLRGFRLVEVGGGNALATSPLRLAERVLHHLLGVGHLDERLAGLVEPVPPVLELAPSHRALAQRIVALWKPVDDAAGIPVVQLTGGEAADRRAIAACACALIQRRLVALPANFLPLRPEELESLRRLWELEAALSRTTLLVECDDVREGAGPPEDVLIWFASRGPVILSGAERRRAWHQPLVTFEVKTPRNAEQCDLWRSALGTAGAELDRQVDQLAAQFHLGLPAIRAAAKDAFAQLESETNGDLLYSALWDACRMQSRPRLDDLAQRIEPAARWEDLVLPERKRGVLRLIAAHVRQRLKVYEHWGFAGKGPRGLGISALFSGSSGTGKTMAAEVLADELRLDLYRIDLSAVVSKYIGETEKNLRRIFDAAEVGGVILLFDEADALFGKRSAVKDSHDRHANIEVSYLLQRIEAYQGLAILTTNIKSALDVAFLRRLRFIVDFPFPDIDQRVQIWQRVFPSKTPTEGLDAQKLGQLNVAGGSIRNIALNAAFLAAEEGEPIRMEHLRRAAKGEFEKVGRSLNEQEVAGWV